MKKMGCGTVVLLRCLESCRREKVHMHDNAVKHGQCVFCVYTHTISIIMVVATLVRYSSHWDTAVCTR